MPNICAECDDGRWQCGDPEEVCDYAGGWEEAGTAYIPVGVGNLTVGVKVWTRMVVPKGGGDPKCIVRLEQKCQPVCKDSDRPKPKKKKPKKKPKKKA